MRDQNIEIIEYKTNQERYFDLWNDFIEKSNNGTIFHRLDFLSYHGSRFQENEHHLMFFQKNELLGVLPLGFFKESGRLIARSPVGASFGGIVTKKDISMITSQSMVASLVQNLKGLSVDTLSLVLPPKIYEAQMNDCIDFFLMKQGAEKVNSDVVSYIPVQKDFLDRFASHARRNTAKALKQELHFKETEDVSTFYTILEKNRREKFDVKPTHSLQEVEYLLKNFPGIFRIFLVFKEDIAIGSLMTIKANAKVLNAFYWAHVEEYQDLRPVNFIFFKLLELAEKEGFQYLDLGPQTSAEEPFEGVIRFKESLGGAALYRNKYILNL